MQQTAFNEAEAALLKNHALHVAAHLVDGEPCPACGSLDHPTPARGSFEGGSLAEIYQSEKAALESARKQSEEARTNAAAARDTLGRREKEFQDLPVPARTAKALADEFAAIKTALESLGPEIDIKALDAKRAGLEAAAANALATWQDDQTAALNSDKAAALARQSLEDALLSVPLELRNTRVLAKRQDALERKIADYTVALEKARADERETNDALIRARTGAVNAAHNKTLAEDQFKTAHSCFVQRLSDAALTEAEYHQSKADIPRVAELEARITDYRERLIRADERLRKAALAIENADRPDIKALKDAKDAAESVLSTLNDLAAGTNARLQHLEKLAIELSEEVARLDRLEQETGPLRELADAFTGRNDMKMELETFAIATMFDHVLEAANLRLRSHDPRPLHARPGNRRPGQRPARPRALHRRCQHRASAPGINPLRRRDIHRGTGARPWSLRRRREHPRQHPSRHHLHRRGLRKPRRGRAMPAPSSRSSKPCRITLGRNRAVGLISHVPLVQQAIPNGFWITKTASGSQIEMRA